MKDKNHEEPTIRIHIVSRRKTWAVIKPGLKKALKVFKFREEAYHYARGLKCDIVVHNRDASILFIYFHQ